MNKMSFEKVNNSLVFVLKSTQKPFIPDKNQKTPPTYKFYCLAADAEEQLSWQIQFEELLDSRKNLMRALQYPQKYSDALQKRESKDDNLCAKKSDK